MWVNVFIANAKEWHLFLLDTEKRDMLDICIWGWPGSASGYPTVVWGPESDMLIAEAYDTDAPVEKTVFQYLSDPALMIAVRRTFPHPSSETSEPGQQKPSRPPILFCLHQRTDHEGSLFNWHQYGTWNNTRILFILADSRALDSPLIASRMMLEGLYGSPCLSALSRTFSGIA